MKMMKALKYEKAGRANATIGMVPYPECGDNDVVIKVMAASICKWAEWNHDHGDGGTLAKYPVTTGHEFAGYVAEVGKNVTEFKVGDRVTADNAIPCGHCWYCKNNRPLMCENFGSIGHNINGGFAQYLVVTQDNVVKFPDGFPFDEACITEPVACAMEAFDRADVKPGDRVIVSGMGPHGLILAQMMAHSNAGKAVAVGLRQDRLDWLEEDGAETLLVDRNDQEANLVKLQETFPDGVDCIIDTSGAWPLCATMFNILKKGGRFIQYGSFHRPIDLENVTQFLNDLHFKNQSYIGVSCQVKNFPRSVEYMVTGKVKVDKIITHTFDLDDYFEALDTNMTDRNALKVVIHPNGDPEAPQEEF